MGKYLSLNTLQEVKGLVKKIHSKLKEGLTIDYIIEDLGNEKSLKIMETKKRAKSGFVERVLFYEASVEELTEQIEAFFYHALRSMEVQKEVQKSIRKEIYGDNRGYRNLII